MKIVLQKVLEAKCTINEIITGKIDKGYLLFVGFTEGDNLNKVKLAAKKIINLRIFEDDNMKMNLNLKAVDGSILSISQFTLYADTKSGNRPSFTNALNPNSAKILYNSFNEELRTYGVNVQEGIFGEHMIIDLVNFGPTTICYDF